MIDQLWRRWEEFWFSPRDPRPLGAFRMFFALNLLIMYTFRQFDLTNHYTDEGVVTAKMGVDVLPEFYRPAIHFYKILGDQPYAWHAGYLFLLVLLVLGLGGRLVVGLALILHLAFLQRNVTVVYGADIISTFFLFYLLVAGGGGRAFSVLSYLRRKKDGIARPDPQWGHTHWLKAAFETLGLRLVQIQLCIVYGYTGMEKLRGQPWWDGTAIWSVLGNKQLAMMDLSWVGNFPFIVGLATHSTLFFEIYFPILVWIKPVRKWLLLFGCALHIGIALSMGLFFFTGAMLAAYCVFLEPKCFTSVWWRKSTDIKRL